MFFLIFVSSSFLPSPFSVKDELKTAYSFKQILLIAQPDEVEKIGTAQKTRTRDPHVDRSLRDDRSRSLERCTVSSLSRGRDPCLCWSAVGVALSQALLSASSMKSAIARNCLELAQSNYPPFPVRVRAYINR